jgi:hypothetical protein
MPNFVQTQQYESSSESDDTMDQRNVQEKKRVKCNFDWIRDKEGEGEGVRVLQLQVIL